MTTLKLDEKELALIITSLEADRLGTWGGTRGEDIKKLLRKIKRGKN